MGVGWMFSTGATREFSKIFLGRAKSGEICFFSLEIKKTTFFAEIFKIYVGQGQPCPPFDAHADYFCLAFIFLMPRKIKLCNAFISEHSFFKENFRYPVWTCRDPISLIVGSRFSLILGTR